jgi:hypothetical protein
MASTETVRIYSASQPSISLRWTEKYFYLCMSLLIAAVVVSRRRKRSSSGSSAIDGYNTSRGESCHGGGFTGLRRLSAQIFECGEGMASALEVATVNTCWRLKLRIESAPRSGPMSMLRETRAKQDAAVEELRKLQRDRGVAAPDRKNAIDAEIAKKNKEIKDLDAVISELINNGAPKT